MILTKGLRQFITYNIIGIINTAIGFSIIFMLMFLGIDPVSSNAIGYAVGSLSSYYLNRRFTFKADGNIWIEAIKFFSVLGVAYLLNYVTLKYLLGRTDPYIAQFFAASIYTFTSFFLSKLLVFKDTT